ncbi:MAG: glycosyltransferase [Actinomycetota bacterium]
MALLTEVPIGRLSPERFEGVLPPEKYQQFRRGMEATERLLHGRVVWSVNSTARGGGVAEMLRSVIAYARGAGMDGRWIVIGGDPEFFRITKRIHNHLHGSPGDGGDLGPDEQAAYQKVLDENAEELARLVRPGDVVVLHDPQTAGLVKAMKATGAGVVWRCHVGVDLPNDLARNAWKFLIDDVCEADAYVFSRRAFAWEGLDVPKIRVVPPSIDAFSPKNQSLTPETVRAIVGVAGIAGTGDGGYPRYEREDGTPARVDRRAEMIEDAHIPADARMVVQVSRWDRLKDPLGVIEGFATYVAPRSDAHLVIAGPSVEAVTDDPEGAEVLEEASSRMRELPPDVRRCVHLACLPMDDGEENAAIVNALQRRADIVVQKSLAEGFGLTVAEAMWKARPVVASRIGGIRDQIVEGVSGVLIDPTNLEEMGTAVVDLLEHPDRAEQLGREAATRIRDEFLGARALLQWSDLFERVLGEKAASA